MARVIEGLSLERVEENLASIREEIDRAAARVDRDPAEVELLAAVKYLPVEELPVLAQAGVALVGENRAQELRAKMAAYGSAFTWDFIGALQSKHVRLVVPHVRLIHSLASKSAMLELERNREQAHPGLGVLVQVKLSGEPSKQGISPTELDAFIADCPLPVKGLMTMPPLTKDPQAARPYFRRLAGLARERGLETVSMGTSQDFAVAVEEGSTIVRIGTRLYA